MQLQCDEIKIGDDRHRKHMGDLAELARSIDAIGLLQPIGVTPDRLLVFGERRLRAVRDVLNRDKIEARTIRIDSIAAGEHAENEIREDFRPSERVAIARTIKAEIEAEHGERRGRPKKTPDGEIPQKIAELESGRETQAVAAERSGFGNKETFRQAEKVGDGGAAVLVRAMDAGEVSISDAASAAKLPKQQQIEAVRAVKSGEAKTIKQAVREINRQRKVEDLAAKARKSERAIMKTTGHRSTAMVRRYIRDADLFDDCAAAGIGL